MRIHSVGMWLAVLLCCVVAPSVWEFAHGPVAYRPELSSEGWWRTRGRLVKLQGVVIAHSAVVWVERVGSLVVGAEEKPMVLLQEVESDAIVPTVDYGSPEEGAVVTVEGRLGLTHPNVAEELAQVTGDARPVYRTVRPDNGRGTLAAAVCCVALLGLLGVSIANFREWRAADDALSQPRVTWGNRVPLPLAVLAAAAPAPVLVHFSSGVLRAVVIVASVALAMSIVRQSRQYLALSDDGLLVTGMLRTHYQPWRDIQAFVPVYGEYLVDVPPAVLVETETRSFRVSLASILYCPPEAHLVPPTLASFAPHAEWLMPEGVEPPQSAEGQRETAHVRPASTRAAVGCVCAVIAALMYWVGAGHMIMVGYGSVFGCAITVLAVPFQLFGFVLGD